MLATDTIIYGLEIESLYSTKNQYLAWLFWHLLISYDIYNYCVPLNPAKVISFVVIVTFQF